MDSLNEEFPDSLVDVVLPYESGYSDPQGADNSDEYSMMGARDFSDELWFEEKEWKDRAKENDDKGLWAESVRDRFTNQFNTHECTAHSMIQGFEAAYNQTRKGNGRPVLLSPLSVYAEANPRERGGANCRNVLEIAINRGILPDHAGLNRLTEQQELFEHTLIGTAGKGNATQSHGRFLQVSEFPSGWEETAKHFRPLAADVVNPKTFEECVCLLLHGRVINVGRSGHAVPWNRLVWRDGDMYAAYADSYDRTLYDSIRTMKGAVSGASSIWSTTIPDDWDYPAGNSSEEKR
jgi:hypothetical protein